MCIGLRTWQTGGNNKTVGRRRRSFYPPFFLYWSIQTHKSRPIYIYNPWCRFPRGCIVFRLVSFFPFFSWLAWCAFYIKTVARFFLFLYYVNDGPAHVLHLSAVTAASGTQNIYMASLSYNRIKQKIKKRTKWGLTCYMAIRNVMRSSRCP